MALADAIKAATSVIPASILPGLATSTVTVKRAPVTGTPGARNADGTSLARSAYPVVVAGLRLFLTEPKGGHMQYAWGAETNAQYEATLAIGVDLREQDSVLVTAGDFAGIAMVVEARQENPLGGIAMLALSGTARSL